ncbi:MAG: response regulator [candidate division Zixibacteria bacterium]|nr:response regulator [candidate division Zixibacteria bacterium]
MGSNELETQLELGLSPVQKAITPDRSHGSMSQQEGRQSDKTTKHAILIVDDEKSILNALKRSLSGENYQIISTDNPQEALELLASNQFSVIISDYTMPSMSGADLLAMVKKKKPRCMRILLTGATETDIVPEEIADSILNCQRFITKPWDDDQLRLAIRECIVQYEDSGK